MLLVAEDDDLLERRNPLALELHLRARLGRLLELRAHLGQYLHIVLRLVRLAHDESLAADLVERVLELVGLVGGVDVDLDDTGESSGVLSEDPFDAVRRPNTHSIAWSYS